MAEGEAGQSEDVVVQDGGEDAVPSRGVPGRGDGGGEGLSEIRSGDYDAEGGGGAVPGTGRSHRRNLRTREKKKEKKKQEKMASDPALVRDR